MMYTGLSPVEEQKGRELAMQMPGLMFKAYAAIPPPVEAALYTVAAGVLAALILGHGRSPVKWGLVGAGSAFAVSAALKGTFTAGLMTGGMTTMQACIEDPREVARAFEDIFQVPAHQVRGMWEGP